MNSPVLFNEHCTEDGHKIVEICLNAERSLNALTLEMIDSIHARLEACRDDDSVVAVLLDGAGEKAFCAGGDVVNLYKSMKGESSPNFIEDFFTREYRLDYLIHTYSKPIICWGSGIVMGGGMGLMNGCSHRIVTETSRLAMPEVTIGFYPDVGGSWFLNRLPGRTGLFLGLTGSSINAADALFLGLADRFIAKELRQCLVERLRAADWTGNAHTAVNQVVRKLERESQPQLDRHSPVQDHYALIQRMTDQDDLPAMVAALLMESAEDKWIARAQQAVTHGSPLAMHLIKRQLENTRQLSLKEVFQSELVLSVQCGRHSEFGEGVRALLVDKDGHPLWRWKKLEEVDQAVVGEFFVSPWRAHPLADIQQQ